MDGGWRCSLDGASGESLRCGAKVVGTTGAAKGVSISSSCWASTFNASRFLISVSADLAQITAKTSFAADEAAAYASSFG